MMGYNHVSCGLVAGIATLPIAPIAGPAAQTAWVLALGGASLLPDLDTTGVALLASLHPVTTGIVLAVTIGLSLRGLALAGVGRIGAPANLIVSALGAAALVAAGANQVKLLPLVMAAGVLIHIAGDWLTDEGIPTPIAWIFGHRDRLSFGLFRVNGPLERAVIAPVLSVAGVLLLASHLDIHDVESLVRWFATQLHRLPPPFNPTA
jgi:hypothetical protein